jgi:hypothetical protein
MINALIWPMTVRYIAKDYLCASRSMIKVTVPGLSSVSVLTVFSQNQDPAPVFTQKDRPGETLFVSMFSSGAVDAWQSARSASSAALKARASCARSSSQGVLLVEATQILTQDVSSCSRTGGARRGTTPILEVAGDNRSHRTD